MRFACSIGFLDTAGRMAWPPSVTWPKWACVSKCTNSRVVGLRWECNLVSHVINVLLETLLSQRKYVTSTLLNLLVRQLRWAQHVVFFCLSVCLSVCEKILKIHQSVMSKSGHCYYYNKCKKTSVLQQSIRPIVHDTYKTAKINFINSDPWI